MSLNNIPIPASRESAYDDSSRFGWAHYPERAQERPGMDSVHSHDPIPEESNFFAPQIEGDKSEFENKSENGAVASRTGHSLFQESFFFCTIKNIGDIRGAGCIYVEAVVDRDSGIAFAKVYSSQNPTNAVNMLASCVIPFLGRQGAAIREIHTRATAEYCGLAPVHPFETFLATSHIEHLRVDDSSRPDNHLCEQFYRLLLKEFFMPALRKKFDLSLADLQKNLDAFVEEYNSRRLRQDAESPGKTLAAANFPVDL